MDNPIGIFDSGIGGLTVVKEILHVLSGESLIYLGDTARVPYGTRGQETIKEFALEMARFLFKKKVKCLVVACNTISATCLSDIQAISSVPVLGVIQPVVGKVLSITKNGRVGIIGTRATITSGIYEKEIEKLNPQVVVITQDCPLFVPLAEEGLISHPATKLIAQDYLKKFLKSKVDTLILGCTHYPLLAEAIKDVVGKNVLLIDSAQPTALMLKNILEEKNLLNQNGHPTYEFYVTDAPERVKKVAERFFGKPLPGKLEKVEIN